MGDVRHVFVVGAKSMGAYGGYETFINKLTEYHQNEPDLQYHVACKANGEGAIDPAELTGAVRTGDAAFVYHNADCFRIQVPERLCSAQAIFYDVAALKMICRKIREDSMEAPVVYILACRIGPFIRKYYKRIHRLGGQVYLNPDGHEWMRGKWSPAVRKYWKLSESLMVKYSDRVICDSINIEKYIHETYDGKGIGGRNPVTKYIAYGAETAALGTTDGEAKCREWMEQFGVQPGGYYLMVARFVPENNFETIIREFQRSKSDKKLIMIATVNNKLRKQLQEKLQFEQDERVVLAGPVYKQELLRRIRENAYGYIHGHEVGGTNPSLLEALGSTKLNLLLDVGFNREVGEEAALYWSKESGNLSGLLEKADAMEPTEIAELGCRAKKRIETAYSWEYIADLYKDVFTASEN